MLLAAPLALLLLAAPDDGRGSPGTTPEDARAQRSLARLRLGLGGGVQFGFSGYSPAFGLGFAGDLGVIVGDRFSMFVHAEVGTVVVTLIASGGMSAEYVFGEHVSAGLGVAFSAWAPLLSGGQGFYGLTFPVRLNFLTVARQAHETRRSGLVIGLQVAPGVSLQPTYYYQVGYSLPPEAAIAGTITVGYSWW
ncbi:MAG: hypothetical protein Q8L48_21690 [Archangium sp.]|nr:hypothetical protein [Archangium sp.]